MRRCSGRLTGGDGDALPPLRRPLALLEQAERLLADGFVVLGLVALHRLRSWPATGARPVTGQEVARSAGCGGWPKAG
jgi:hypothetical protein